MMPPYYGAAKGGRGGRRGSTEVNSRKRGSGVQTAVIKACIFFPKEGRKGRGIV
jgi:hypothetical protein